MSAVTIKKSTASGKWLRLVHLSALARLCRSCGAEGRRIPLSVCQPYRA